MEATQFESSLGTVVVTPPLCHMEHWPWPRTCVLEPRSQPLPEPKPRRLAVPTAQYRLVCESGCDVWERSRFIWIRIL